MTKFYVNNLSLQDGDIRTISGAVSTGDSKKPIAPAWVPQSTNSTDILIKSLKPRLYPQLMAALLTCWVNLASGASLGYATPALPSLQHPNSRLYITESQGSWVAGLVMLGALAGGVLAGPCISLGRRRALWLVAPPLTLAWVLIALAPNVRFLYIAHFILGMCLGIIADASQIYVSETASAQWRGALGCIPVLMFNVGILICYTAGAWLDWQNLAFFGGGLTLPALLFPIVVPESPSYLVAQGQMEEAIAALHWLRGPTYDITSEYHELLHCEKGPGVVQRLKSLCDRDMIRPLLLTGAIRAFSRFCGVRAILCYTQTILLSSQSSLDVEVATIITGAVQLIATFIACGLLDRLGRRKLLIASQGVMGLSLIGLAFYHYYHEDLRITSGDLVGWLPVIAITVYIVANSIGLGPVSGIVIGELVPQRHRSIASSITGAISWLSAFIVTKTFLDLKSVLNIHGTMWLYGSVCLTGVLFVYFSLPETRGISQYDIDVLFRANRDHNNGLTETKMGQSKSLMVLQVPTDKAIICDECSTHTSNMSSPDDISV